MSDCRERDEKSIMARTTEEEEEMLWGTWEELLLACAVSRHGTKNWDSVAMEVRTRSSAPHFLLTPHNCKQRYLDLHRRFTGPENHGDCGGGGDDVEHESDERKADEENDGDEIPWLEELRKRRVAELKREVQRYDVSIVSLQLKVKRLKEERERGVRTEEENNDAKPDLEKQSRDEGDNRKPNLLAGDKPELSSPATGDLNPVTSEESGRENQSFNESNSTDQKAEKPDSGPPEPENQPKPKPESEPTPEKTAGGEPDPLSGESPEDKMPAAAVAEGSYNGSSDTVAKDWAVPAAEKRSDSAVPTRKSGGDSAELRESVAESKGGEDEGVKENSDVQSSASLSKKQSRRKKDASASSSGGGVDEPETEEVSPAIERVSVESEPLMGVLEIIKSHKHGSVFERRLYSQESTQYKSLVRQHLDLRTIETRLKEGWYSGCSAKFHRDLLLLFNNAIVFFPKTSAEFSAAVELRDLFSKHIGSVNQLSVQQSEASTPLTATTAAPTPVISVPKPDPEPSESLLAKHKSSGPIIVCRKRSSIAAKAAGSTGEKKADQRGGATVGEAKKPVLADRKQQQQQQQQQQQMDSSDNDKNNNTNNNNNTNASKSAVVVEEQSVMNNRKRDGTVSGTRSSRPSTKNRNNNNNTNNQIKNSNLNNTQKNSSSNTNMGSAPKGAAAAAAAADDDSSDSKPAEKEKKNNKDNTNNSVTAVAKKRSVANFLNRMKRNSASSNNGTLLETLKSSGSSGKGASGGGGGTAEQKRSSGRSTETRRQSSAAKQQEQSSPAKRSVGRPPKRAPPPPPPPPSSSKRTREVAEAEAVAATATRQPRKRSRR